MTSAQNRRHLTPLRVYRNVLYAAAFKQAQGLLDTTNQFKSVREAIGSWKRRDGSEELVQFVAYADIFFEWKGDHIVAPQFPQSLTYMPQFVSRYIKLPGTCRGCWVSRRTRVAFHDLPVRKVHQLVVWSHGRRH